MKKEENLTIHDCLNHDKNPRFDVDPVIEQQRQVMKKKLEEAILEKASALGVSVGELLDRYRPRVDFLTENKGGKSFYVTMKVWFEPTQP